MNLLRTYFTNRKYLLPFVMMAAVIFIIQGISAPSFNNPLEPRLSNPEKAKPSTSAVIKTLQHSSQLKITKSSQFFDLLDKEHKFEHPYVQASSPHYASASIISAAVPPIPARAPPA
jgi:hypothetical protein